jgi:uncharacterized membrane protein YphA (DoxX/SURF4 family)
LGYGTPKPAILGRSAPLTAKLQQIGLFAALAIFALRVGVGWHFFKEGIKKFSDDFSSRPFLEQAKGPLAGYYRMLIPDWDGRQRLNRDRIVQDWKEFVRRAGQKFGFDDRQQELAEQALRDRVRQLDWYFDTNREDIDEYLLELDRLARAKQRSSSQEIPYERERLWAKDQELRGKRTPWLSELRQYHDMLQQDINRIGQSEEGVTNSVSLPDRGAIPSDLLVKYGITAIGVCLVVGLFTRLAALGGILFLISVLLSQPFWVPGADTQFAYYQMVEVLALVVLVAFAAGRYGGLDFFLNHLGARCCQSKHKGEDDV